MTVLSKLVHFLGSRVPFENLFWSARLAPPSLPRSGVPPLSRRWGAEGRCHAAGSSSAAECGCGSRTWWHASRGGCWPAGGTAAGSAHSRPWRGLGARWCFGSGAPRRPRAPPLTRDASGRLAYLQKQKRRKGVRNYTSSNSLCDASATTHPVNTLNHKHWDVKTHSSWGSNL